MEVGTIRWFNEKKGFGFIQSADGTDIFLHYKNIIGEGFKTVHEGDKVEFKSVNGDKGLHAEEVLVVR